MTKTFQEALLCIPPDWTDVASVKARLPDQLSTAMKGDLLADMERAKLIESRKTGDPIRPQVRLTPKPTKPPTPAA